MAGAVNLFGEAGRHSPWMTWEELESADPDVLLIAPCGFDLDRTEHEMHWLTDRDPAGAASAPFRKGACISPTGINISTAQARALWRRSASFCKFCVPKANQGTGWRRFSSAL